MSLRCVAPHGDWVTPIWLSVNWGKKTILTDIKHPDGKKRFVDLLASADVLLSSQRPGALDRLGLSDAELREINPNLDLRVRVVRLPGYALGWAPGI